MFFTVFSVLWSVSVVIFLFTSRRDSTRPGARSIESVFGRGRGGVVIADCGMRIAECGVDLAVVGGESPLAHDRQLRRRRVTGRTSQTADSCVSAGDRRHEAQFVECVGR